MVCHMVGKQGRSRAHNWVVRGGGGEHQEELEEEKKFGRRQRVLCEMCEQRGKGGKENKKTQIEPELWTEKISSLFASKIK